MARSPSLIADHTNHASCTRWAAPSYPPTRTVTRNRSDGAAQAGVAFRQVGSPCASSSVVPTEWAVKSPCAPRTTRTFGTLRMIDWSPMVRLQLNSSPSFRRNDCSGASRIDVPLSAKVTTRVSRAVGLGAAVACGLTTGVGGGGLTVAVSGASVTDVAPTVTVGDGTVGDTLGDGVTLALPVVA